MEDAAFIYQYRGFQALVNSLFSAENLIAAAVTLLVVLAAVVIHHEALSALYHRLPSLGGRSRSRMLILAFTILATHTVEIWLFGAAYWWLLVHLELGALVDKTPPDAFDLLYFSASAYTTAGWGDVVVTGPVRILAGTEALVGLVLITWSASFTYSELHRTWEK